METQSATIFGVRLDLSDYEQILQKIGNAIEDRRRLIVTGPHFSILLDARADQELCGFLNSCHVNHPDGIGTVLAIRYLSGINYARINGTDLYARILQRFPPGSTRYFFFGGDEETVRRLQGVLSESGYSDESFEAQHGQTDVENHVAAERIAAFAPSILFVGLGSPKQFAWIARWRGKLEVPVIVAVGGGLEFLSGRRRRAPGWMRAAGLEWLHRILLEPGRLWRRYFLGIPSFVLAVLLEKRSR